MDEKTEHDGEGDYKKMSEKIKIKKEITMEDLKKIAGGSAVDLDDYLSGPPYTCPICSAVIPTKDEFLWHLTGDIQKQISDPQNILG